MKKLAILSMMFLFAFSVLQAQTQKLTSVPLKKLEGTAVSDKSKTNFRTDFGNVKDVQSKRVDTFDEFSFTGVDGQKMTAFYDSQGLLVGTTQKKTLADLPAKGQQAIKDKYKDYKVGSVIYFDDNERNDSDMILWATQFDDEDLYFAELIKGTSKIIVKVNPSGDVSLFKQL